MPAGKIILYILSAYVIIAALLPLIKTPHWWIRAFDFPRLHHLVISLLLIFSFIFFFTLTTADWVTILFLSASIIFQGAQIIPFTVFYSKETRRTDSPDKKNTFSILICNIRMYNRDDKSFKARIAEEQPDIIAMNEPDEWWEECMKNIEEKYPHQVKVPQDNTYGMLLYSRLELIDPEVRHLLEEDIPSIVSKISLPSGATFCLYCLHPQPPKPANDTDERDAELLITGKTIKKRREPAIIVGDLNDVGWSHTTRLFRRISQMLDPRIGRGFFNTYNAQLPIFRYPLDHVFHTDHFKLVEMRKLKKVGSDHFPMLVTFEFAPKVQHEEKPKPNKSDKKEAKEKIRNGEEAAEE